MPEIETALYRIVQEALTNAAKHGRASRAAVDVTEDEHHIHVLVRDDGSGFDPATRTEGFGLLGVRERVELLEGALSVESTPGRGTTISAELPALHRSDTAPGPDDQRARNRASSRRTAGSRARSWRE